MWSTKYVCFVAIYGVCVAYWLLNCKAVTWFKKQNKKKRFSSCFFCCTVANDAHFDIDAYAVCCRVVITLRNMRELIVLLFLKIIMNQSIYYFIWLRTLQNKAKKQFCIWCEFRGDSRPHQCIENIWWKQSLKSTQKR